MTTLIHQCCWHHPSRQAVVRCPACHRYYCRECVTEHRGLMMCSACFTEASHEASVAGSSGFAPWIIFAIGGLFLAWLTFYYVGVALARIPSDFFA